MYKRQELAARPAAPRPVSKESLAAAAAFLAGGVAGASRTAVEGLTVRCTDWGGVVNCPRPFEAAVDLCRLAGLAPAALVSPLVPPPGAGGGPDASNAVAAGEPWSITIAQLVEARRAQAETSVHVHGPRVRLPTRYGVF